MKNILRCILVASALVISAHAQTPPATPADTYTLGDRKVRVPAPDSFVEISSQFPRVLARMKASEDPNNQVLAVHLPESFLPKLKVSEDIDLEFYTKVSASKRAATTDATPEFFSGVVASLEKNFGAYMDPDSSLVKRVESNASRNLTELFGKNAAADFKGTRNLGFFEKTDKVFSGMTLVTLEIYGRNLTILGTFSVVRVNQRLVFLYAAKMFPEAKDVDMLRDFTKKWTAKTVGAN